MKLLWLLILPLLFLPNFGFAIATGFGTFELSDVFILPFIFSAWIAADRRSRLNVNRITLLLGVFLYWALLSTVTISFRYGYLDIYYVVFGLLKIVKWSLYAFAGILMARAIGTRMNHDRFQWSLLAAATVNGIGLQLTRLPTNNSLDANVGYSATNAISVTVAILLSYIGGRLLAGDGTLEWRRIAPWALTILIVGFALSEGRGGWLAAIAASLYIAARLGPTRQVLTAAFSGVVMVVLLYNALPQFREEVDKTLFPPESTSTYQGTRVVGSLDDGARFEHWIDEFPKFFDAPVFGTGFFHRGGESGIYSTGSHNFFLQMFLELGIVGGVAIVLVFVTIWRQALLHRQDSQKGDVPIRAALVAAVVGGFGGEYFYGGVVFLSLLAAYAPTGSLAIADFKHADVGNRLEMKRALVPRLDH